MTLKLVSSAFTEGGAIPKKYTCEGQDVSPPLAWSGVPQGAKSLVLIVDDPDAPDPKAPKMTWVHSVSKSPRERDGTSRRRHHQGFAGGNHGGPR